MYLWKTQPETSYWLFVCQGRCQFAYCSTNTLVFESQLIAVWNDGGKLLESRRKEELFLKQSTFTVKSDEYDGKHLLSVVAIPLVVTHAVTSEGAGKCSEDNVVITAAETKIEICYK